MDDKAAMPLARPGALAEFEKAHDLYALKIDGWSMWRVMRHAIYRLAIALPLAQPPRSTSTRICDALKATFVLLRLLVCGGQRDLLVKTCRSGLRMQIGDRYRDVYFDGVLDDRFSYIKLEEINSPDFDEQAKAALHPSSLDPVAFTFWGRVLSILLPVRASGAFCTSVAELLEDAGGLEISSRWLRTRVSTVYWQARLYGLLLRRVRPRAVLVSDTGEYALCLACKRLGIRFIELQHGVFDAEHPDAIPADAPGTSTELLLPDVLACRSQFWIDRLATTKQGQECAVAVGNELIDMARQSRLTHRRGECRHLVLSSQGLDSVRLAKWIEELLAVAPALEWRLSIKLHPVYDSDSAAFQSVVGGARVHVIGGASQPNIFDLLIDADLHLSIASACHYDAAALGVPSVVIPLTGHESILDAVDNKQLFLAQTPHQVWELLTSHIAVDGVQNYYSAPNFKNNFNELLEGVRPITLF